MRSDAGPEMETETGCRLPNQNSYINNNMVFNMMDKYSSQHSMV
jgi:hypothetical protein